MLDVAKRAGICVVIGSALVWSVGALSAREATVAGSTASVQLAAHQDSAARAVLAACAGQTWPNLSAECLAAGSGQPARPAPRRIAIGGQ